MGDGVGLFYANLHLKQLFSRERGGRRFGGLILRPKVGNMEGLNSSRSLRVRTSYLSEIR